MADRFPLVIDTTNGNSFAELPDGDNLLMTNSSITNALNISAIGTTTTKALDVNDVLFSGTSAGNLTVTGNLTMNGLFTTKTYSTIERDALSGVANGTIIYNASDNKFQGYAGGTWVDLH